MHKHKWRVRSENSCECSDPNECKWTIPLLPTLHLWRMWPRVFEMHSRNGKYRFEEKLQLWENLLQLQKIESYWRCYLHMITCNLFFWILLLHLKSNSFTAVFFQDLNCRLVQSAVRILLPSCGFGRCQVMWTTQGSFSFSIAYKSLGFVHNTLLECWLECLSQKLSRRSQSCSNADQCGHAGRAWASLWL